MWTRRGHPSTTADMVLSWGEVLYRASVMLAGLIIVLAAINCLYQVSILEEPIIPVVPFVLAAAIWLVGVFLPPDVCLMTSLLRRDRRGRGSRRGGGLRRRRWAPERPFLHRNQEGHPERKHQRAGEEHKAERIGELGR